MRLYKSVVEFLITFASFWISLQVLFIQFFLYYLRRCQENQLAQIDYIFVEKEKTNWIKFG